LLIKHKNVKIRYLCGNTSVGKKISYYDKSLTNKKLPKITKFTNKYLNNVDIIFTALPNGEAQSISNNLLKKNTLIDLAADFRLEKASDYLKWYKQKHKAKKNIKKSIYALPEIVKNKVKRFNIIGCPGCYPTSILLPLIPLTKSRSIEMKNIIVDSKSGYSGAGRGVHKKFKNKNLYESLSVYGVGFHRHNSEINQELRKYNKSKINLIFTPHLTPMFKGILSTIYVDLKAGVSIKKIHAILKKFHKNNKFVKVLNIGSMISTNDVINTNNCLISVCKTNHQNSIIILSAIDNLIKGGAGQAIQNMNIKFDFDYNEGFK
jgi:N-acetyl-gamma-glutamyl-phosphate reductase